MNIESRMAEAVASARLGLEQAETAYRAACQGAEAVRERIAACEARQAEITAHRLAGEATEALNAEFAALAGDIAVLEGALTETEAAAAGLEPAEHRNRLAAAENDWRQHQVRVRIATLQAKAADLESLFCSCLAALAAEARLLGHDNMSMVWSASDDLKRFTNHTFIGHLSRAA